ncbi:hypothetical protein L3Y34_019555 [Caenorhabditis briggsae]|uniref:Uncharacterized protein n=1 Tax=Caenorhabditis briggsae TaxID=6238 RepID=A0AAE9DN94_CAEBR|nr:hypothetical protein L3Y34_019555 [Caenorhabditis briggsae]
MSIEALTNFMTNITISPPKVTNISLLLLSTFFISDLHSFEDSKIDGILKKVGKRYIRRDQKMMGLIDRYHRLKEWDGLDEYTRDEYVINKATEITRHIFG